MKLHLEKIADFFMFFFFYLKRDFLLQPQTAAILFLHPYIMFTWFRMRPANMLLRWFKQTSWSLKSNSHFRGERFIFKNSQTCHLEDCLATGGISQQLRRRRLFSVGKKPLPGWAKSYSKQSRGLRNALFPICGCHIFLRLRGMFIGDPFHA